MKRRTLSLILAFFMLPLFASSCDEDRLSQIDSDEIFKMIDEDGEEIRQKAENAKQSIKEQIKEAIEEEQEESMNNENAAAFTNEPENYSAENNEDYLYDSAEESSDKNEVIKNDSQSELTNADLICIPYSDTAAPSVDERGLKLSCESVADTKILLKTEQASSDTEGQLYLQKSYKLYYQGDYDCQPVAELATAEPLSDEFFAIELFSIYEDTIDLTARYGKLNEGRYVLEKICAQVYPDGSREEHNYYALFDLVNAVDFDTVTFRHEDIELSLPYFDDYCYIYYDYSENSDSFGIGVKPKGEKGYLDILIWQGFGTCGTGLTVEEREYPEGIVSFGTYDNSPCWSFATVNKFSEKHPGYSLVAMPSFEAVDWIIEEDMTINEFFQFLEFN